MNINKTFAKILSTAICICMISMIFIYTTIDSHATVSEISLAIDYTRFTSGSDSDENDIDVYVNNSSASYYVDDWVITNYPYNGWTKGTKPILKITLYMNDDEKFGNIYSSNCHLFGTGATYSSSSKADNSTTLYLTVKLLAVGSSGSSSSDSLEVSDLYWNTNDGSANWNDATDADKYQVRLYKGSSLKETRTTSNTYHYFNDYITSTGDYCFSVRARDEDGNYGDWYDSDIWTVTSSDIKYMNMGNNNTSYGGPGSSQASSSGAWLKDNTGWWYCNADRSYTINNWQYINNKWYYFNGNGYMVTGWIYWKNIWYYCGPGGDMYVNRYTPDGYYVDYNGAWVQNYNWH